MTRKQAIAIADWVDCCARLQQLGESFIESGPRTHTMPQILLVSVASIIIANTLSASTTDANLSHRVATLDAALAKACADTVRALAAQSHH